MATEQFWAGFWDKKAAEPTDFQATGRGRMDSVGFLYTVRECANLLKLRSDDRVLDIGCGTGIFALALSPFVQNISAFDISPAAVARAANNLSDAQNVTVKAGSIISIPSADGQFDKALAYSVLQYLESGQTVLAAFHEVARTLKPGGIALFAGNPDPPCRKMVEDEIRANNDEPAAGKYIALLAETLWISAEDLIAFARQAGLDAKRVGIHQRIQQHTYMFDLVASKRA